MAYGDYQDFLLKLDQQRNKIIYARVTALNIREEPVETIEGRVNGGSINIDGASAVRRTCSFTILAQDFDYSDYVWGNNVRFRLEIGVQNDINPEYDNIIWFKQGTYVLTSFNTSRSTNNFTISIQGKDKMCLLNGEIGGTLDASIDFGCIEEEDADGIWNIRKIPIQDIIRNVVHTYGGEPYHNIVINDLDTVGLELLEYRYDVPMYLYREPAANIFTNILLENDKTNVIANGTSTKLKDLTTSHLDPLLSSLNTANPPTVQIDSKNWVLSRIKYGDTCGYRVTDLTYAGDLITKAGESLTSVLDKIKNMLAEFEYFYDLDGRFVFQKKQSFISTLWSTTNSSANEVTEALDSSSSHSYYFNNNELVISFNHNPTITNVKNDYVIWGERKGVAGGKIPIHLRYAIDSKPTKYTQIRVEESEVEEYNNKYNTLLRGNTYPKTFNSADTYSIESDSDGNIIVVNCDWREVIYQMALDYYKYNFLDDFEIRVMQANSANGLYTTGRTGYEQYYTDLQGFWRQLYNPVIDEEINELVSDIEDKKVKLTNTINFLYGSTSDKGILTPGFTAKLSKVHEEQKANLAQEFKNWVNNNNGNSYVPIKNSGKSITSSTLSGIIEEAQSLYQQLLSIIPINENELANMEKEYDSWIKSQENFYNSGSYQHWNKDVYESPETLNFWFDFLDSESELSQFSVKAIGSRPKVVNDNNINSIYFRDTPNVIFQEYGDQNLAGKKNIQVSDIESMFTVSAQGKSARDKLDELLYQHGYCSESATINTIPIYYLQPNTRIFIHDDDTNLHGDYIVSKLTIPLTYNGTMSITATKAAKNIM